MHETEIAIVGCGPVGGLMANLLGQRGIRTVVLEKETGIYQLPRAVGMDDEVMRVLQSLDLAHAYTKDVFTLKGMDLLRRNRRMLRRVTLLKEDETLGFPVLTLFHQPTLEGHIREGIKRFPDSVQVRTGVEVREIRDAEDAVQLDVYDASTDEVETIQARYVLGCDGGRSFVRSRYDVAQEDLQLHQPWVVVDVIMKRPIEVSGYAEQMCDPRRPGTFVPSPPPRNRWEFMLMPGDDPEQMTKPESLRELIRPWASPDDYEVERAAVYTFHALIARKWRLGRGGNILILGDAAHQMPPFLGQGMCAGVRDAFNLAWKLDLVLRGAADQRLLDTFQSERADHVRQVIRLAVRIGKIIQSPSRLHSFFVNMMMVWAERLGIDMPIRSTKAMPLGPGFYSQKNAPKSAQRCPFPQPKVEHRDVGVTRLDACLGPAFTLITRTESASQGSDNQSSPLVTTLNVQPSSTNKDCASSVKDTEGTIEAWMNDHQCDAVLLRPDRQPFGLYSGAQAHTAYILHDLEGSLGADVRAGISAAAV